MSGFVFLDTSALAKRYHREKGTAEVDHWLEAPGKRHIISMLAFVEVQSVFAKKVREGLIPESDFILLRVLVSNDVVSGLFQIEPLTSRHFFTAEKLIAQHGLTNHIRTLDALQLAVAVELRRNGQADHFLCADDRLCALAAKEGFAVVNPETAS